jgi:hypothetical protein
VRQSIGEAITEIKACGVKTLAQAPIGVGCRLGTAGCDVGDVEGDRGQQFIQPRPAALARRHDLCLQQRARREQKSSFRIFQHRNACVSQGFVEDDGHKC